jgi:hypothetical protein
MADVIVIFSGYLLPVGGYWIVVIDVYELFLKINAVAVKGKVVPMLN